MVKGRLRTLSSIVRSRKFLCTRRYATRTSASGASSCSEIVITAKRYCHTILWEEAIDKAGISDYDVLHLLNKQRGQILFCLMVNTESVPMCTVFRAVNKEKLVEKRNIDLPLRV